MYRLSCYRRSSNTCVFREGKRREAELCLYFDIILSVQDGTSRKGLKRAFEWWSYCIRVKFDYLDLGNENLDAEPGLALLGGN